MPKPMSARALEHWMLESPWARGKDKATNKYDFHFLIHHTFSEQSFE